MAVKRPTMDKAFTRRKVLKTMAATAITGAPFILSSRAIGAPFLNEPTGSTVKLGFTVPQSGPFIDEGADELRGFELAVKHLNGEGDGGMLNTMQPSLLQGNGILGKQVEFVVADTQTKSDAARAAATSLIEDEGVSMISGGSSSGVAIAMQQVCEDKGIVFMAGLAHANDVTGRDKSANGFRHYLNAYMSDKALVNVLSTRHGNERSAYYLTADYTWGWQNQATIQAESEALGWRTINALLTPLATTDFTSYITPIIDSGADTLILSHYGGNMVNSLAAAQRAGLQDLQVNGNDFVIAIPVHTELMARGAGSALEGVYGTVNWHASLQDAASVAFTASFNLAYGKQPSAAAHTCYVQTLLYADACERANSFDPCLVATALEGHSFDGLGNGATEYRSGDHQCLKDVPVVKGENSLAQLAVTDIVPRSAVEYPTDQALFGEPLEQRNACGDASGSGSNDNTSTSDNETTTTDNPTDNTPESSGGGGAVGASIATLLSMQYVKNRTAKKDQQEHLNREESK